MHRKTFILMFVAAWYCVNTVNGSPISFENKLKCGNRCKTDEVRIRINEDQWDEVQDEDLSIDEHVSTFAGRVIPKRKKRQTKNDQPVPVPLNATPQLDDDELPPQRKDATDFTVSTEYKRAQENLLSASEQIEAKDSPVAPEDDNSLLNAENLSDGNIQATTGIESVGDVQPETDLINLISSPATPDVLGETNDGDVLVTQVLKETQETVLLGADEISAKSDNSVEGGTFTPAVDVATPKKTTETKSTTIDTSVTISNTPVDSKEPFMPEADNSEPSIDGTVLRQSTVPVDNAYTKLTVPADATENKKEVVVPGPREPTENNLNEVVTGPVKEAEADGDTSPNSAETSETPEISTKPDTANTLDEPFDNVSDEKNSLKEETTRKLDIQPELEQVGTLKLEVDSVDNISVDVWGTTKNVDTSDNKVEIQDASKKDKDIATIPDTSPTPLNCDTRREEPHQNGKDGTTQDFSINRHENSVYNIDDWHEEFTEPNSFDDLIEDPCDCGHTEFSANYDNVLVNHDSDDTIEYGPFEEPCEDNCDPTDYSSNYDNIEENHDHSAGSVDYSQRTYDKPRDFFDDLEPENVFDDLFNSDIEFNRQHENDIQTALFEHFDEDADHFDEDVDDIYR